MTTVQKQSLLDFIGYRVTLELDDKSLLQGRLLSLSSAGNLILSECERQICLKRKRGDTGPAKWRREVYDSVLFIRGDSVVNVRYTKSITTDNTVVNRAGGKMATTSRKIDLSTITPSVPK
ncbi:Lsm5p [Angomonas deanei]|uniref:LSM domain containing protein, putative n=1 Tax=Angomonas deanei TaxID=59799 RepID=S9VNJ0_9TRYP|nr:Lsm5p [Angomonas deanei]EPY39112.1 Lsm5p [Angomonas deanei]CAD2217963.1 LSM domain containing protein, putative [Angomonas deanei]|eukprot:EPY24845.1 Lsm5p [Angomonas deanei]